MENDARRIRELLNGIAEVYTEMAKGSRTTQPENSFRWFRESESFRKAAEAMERMEPTEPEIEGDRWTWFYVCGDCHTAISPVDKFCRQCGRPLKWDEMTSEGPRD